MKRTRIMVLVKFLMLGVVFAAISAAASDSPTASEKRLQQPQWWKGCLHAHSLWSDGHDFPEMIAKWYKNEGYNFLAFTDHYRLQEGERWVPENLTKGFTEEEEEAIRRYKDEFKNEVETRPGGALGQYRTKPLDEYRSKYEEPGRFLLMPGEEVTNTVYSNGDKLHMIAINIKSVIPSYDKYPALITMQKNLQAILNQSSSQNPVLAAVCHPNIKQQTTFSTDMLAKLTDLTSSTNKLFLEVYNGHAVVYNFGWDETTKRPSVEAFWDRTIARCLIKDNPILVYGLATDDAHDYVSFLPDKCNPGRAWVMVRANELTPESLLDAMNRGDFYASTGVKLKDVSVRDNKLCVEVDPDQDENVSYRIRFIGLTKVPDKEAMKRNVEKMDQGIRLKEDVIGTKAEYEFQGNELYVRATVISNKLMPNPPAMDCGFSRYKEENEVNKVFERAWTQPVLVPSNLAK